MDIRAEKDSQCAGCEHSDRCEEVYRRVSYSKGPSVAWKVFFAFLVPILVFIAALLVLDYYRERSGIAISEPAGFFIALAASGISVLIISILMRVICKDNAADNKVSAK